MLQMVARLRVEADECERRMLGHRDKVRSLREAGQAVADDDGSLAELELAYDRLIADMQTVLDELDRQGASPAVNQSVIDSHPSSP